MVRHQDNGPAGQPPRAESLRILAPVDCTGAGELTRFIASTVEALRENPRLVVIDLSNTTAMNCLLLSAVVYLAREAGRRGIHLRVEAPGSQFATWASAMGLAPHLARRGVFDGHEAV